MYYLISFIVQGKEVLKEEGTMYVDSKVLKADTASRMSEDRNPRARRLRVEAVPREEASMVSMVDPASRMREG